MIFAIESNLINDTRNALDMSIEYNKFMRCLRMFSKKFD